MGSRRRSRLRRCSPRARYDATMSGPAPRSTPASAESSRRSRSASPAGSSSARPCGTRRAAKTRARASTRSQRRSPVSPRKGSSAPGAEVAKTEQPVLFFATQADLEAWMDEHGEESDGIWLKFAKKDSGIESVVYAQAIAIALSYGWIDGQAKRLDDHHYL